MSKSLTAIFAPSEDSPFLMETDILATFIKLGAGMSGAVKRLVKTITSSCMAAALVACAPTEPQEAAGTLPPSQVDGSQETLSQWCLDMIAASGLFEGSELDVSSSLFVDRSVDPYSAFDGLTCGVVNEQVTGSLTVKAFDNGGNAQCSTWSWPKLESEQWTLFENSRNHLRSNVLQRGNTVEASSMVLIDSSGNFEALNDTTQSISFAAEWDFGEGFVHQSSFTPSKVTNSMYNAASFVARTKFDYNVLRDGLVEEDHSCDVP